MAPEVKLLMDQSDRFWSKVDKSGKCWPWTGRKDKDGYGKFDITLPRFKNGKQNQKHLRAHRVAYMLVHGYVPHSILLLHSCDNPPCCNPDHVSPGTQLQNRIQCRDRGRTARGQRHGRSKLTEADARKVIHLREVIGLSRKLIGSMFNISTQTAGEVGTRYWRHL